MSSVPAGASSVPPANSCSMRPDAEAAKAGSARRHPAADGRELPGLRLVTDGQAVSARGRRRGRARWCRCLRSRGRSARRARATAGQAGAIHRDDRVGEAADGHAADDAGPAAVRDQARALLAGKVEDGTDASAVPGRATASGTASSRPERSAMRSGKDWPRARRTRSSGSSERLSVASRREARARQPRPRRGSRRAVASRARRSPRGSCARRRRRARPASRRPSRSSVACVHRARTRGARHARNPVVVGGDRLTRAPGVRPSPVARGSPVDPGCPVAGVAPSPVARRAPSPGSPMWPSNAAISAVRAQPPASWPPNDVVRHGSRDATHDWPSNDRARGGPGAVGRRPALSLRGRYGRATCGPRPRSPCTEPEKGAPRLGARTWTGGRTPSFAGRAWRCRCPDPWRPGFAGPGSGGPVSAAAA